MWRTSMAAPGQDGQLPGGGDRALPGSLLRWPALGQLYLPEASCQDPERRATTRVPEKLSFHTKPELALLLLDQAGAAGIPFAWVGADAGYGDNPHFLDGSDQRQVGCVVGVASDFGVRLLAEVAAATTRQLPIKKQAGRPRTHPHPVQVAPLQRAAAVLANKPETAWHTTTWRQGSPGPLTKQFSALRIRRGHANQTGPKGWLIGERPLPGQEGDPSSIGAICGRDAIRTFWPSWRIGVPVSNAATKTAKVRPAWATMWPACGTASIGN